MGEAWLGFLAGWQRGLFESGARVIDCGVAGVEVCGTGFVPPGEEGLALSSLSCPLEETSVGPCL